MYVSSRLHWLGGVTRLECKGLILQSDLFYSTSINSGVFKCSITSLASPQIDLNSRSLFSYFYTNYCVLLLFPENLLHPFPFLLNGFTPKSHSECWLEMFFGPLPNPGKDRNEILPWPLDSSLPDPKRKNACAPPASYAWPFITSRQRLTKALIAVDAFVKLRAGQESGNGILSWFRNVESIGIVAKSSDFRI